MNEDVKSVLNQLIAKFFQAVSFEAGQVPDYENIHQIFIERGLLIKNSTATPEISGVADYCSTQSHG